MRELTWMRWPFTCASSVSSENVERHHRPTATSRMTRTTSTTIPLRLRGGGADSVSLTGSCFSWVAVVSATSTFLPHKLDSSALPPERAPGSAWPHYGDRD